MYTEAGKSRILARPIAIEEEIVVVDGIYNIIQLYFKDQSLYYKMFG